MCDSSHIPHAGKEDGEILLSHSGGIPCSQGWVQQQPRNPCWRKHSKKGTERDRNKGEKTQREAKAAEERDPCRNSKGRVSGASNK